MKPKLLAITLLAIFLVGCQQPARKVVDQQYAWKEFRSSEGGFSIVMPGTPSQETRTANTAVGRIDLNMFSVNKGDEGVYTVMYGDYPESYIQEITAEVLLDAARDGGVAGVGGKLLGEEIISLDEYPGRQINMEVVGGAGRQKSCMFLVGRRLYQVSWTGPKEKAYLKSVGEFLDSFKLLETPKPGEFSTFSKYGVSFKYPKNWRVDDTSSGRNIGSVVVEGGNEVLGIGWNKIRRKQTRAHLEVTLSFLFGFYILSKEIAYFKMGESAETIKAGHLVLYQYVTFTTTDGAKWYEIQGVFYCDKNKRQYRLLYKTRTKEDVLENFQGYLDSFVCH